MAVVESDTIGSLNKYLQDNFSTVPIRWSGVEFNTKNKTTWIAFHLTTGMRGATRATEEPWRSGRIDIGIFNKVGSDMYTVWDIYQELRTLFEKKNISLLDLDTGGTPEIGIIKTGDLAFVHLGEVDRIEQLAVDLTYQAEVY